MCRTPYHETCWAYSKDRCAVYGCPEAQAERDPLPSLGSGSFIAIPEAQPRPTGGVTLIVVVMTVLGVCLSRLGKSRGASPAS